MGGMYCLTKVSLKWDADVSLCIGSQNPGLGREAQLDWLLAEYAGGGWEEREDRAIGALTFRAMGAEHVHGRLLAEREKFPSDSHHFLSAHISHSDYMTSQACLQLHPGAQLHILPMTHACLRVSAHACMLAFMCVENRRSCSDTHCCCYINTSDKLGRLPKRTMGYS